MDTTQAHRRQRREQSVNMFAYESVLLDTQPPAYYKIFPEKGMPISVRQLFEARILTYVKSMKVHREGRGNVLL